MNHISPPEASQGKKVSGFCGSLQPNAGGAVNHVFGAPVRHLARAPELAQPLIGAEQPAAAVWADAICVETEGACLFLDGHPWLATQPARSRADVAAILVREFLTQGAQILERLQGSFAIAAIDTRRQTVLLAVDRFGISSLCFRYDEDERLSFATSPAALPRMPGVAAQIDPQALYAYLYFHMVPSPLSIFRGAVKLEPAQYMLARAGQRDCRRYWQPRFVEANAEDFTALKRELLPTVRAAVMRCQPDANTGSFLSGGLDSSTVAGCLAEATHGAAPAFSMGFATAGYDELEYARGTARHFGMKLIEHLVTAADVVRVIPVIARAYGEPFGNSSAVPTFICAAVAREHGITHMLAGDGGDELFGGNSRYATQKLFDIYSSVPATLRRQLLEPLFLRSPLGGPRSPLHKVRRYIEQALIPMPARSQTWNLLETLGPRHVFAPAFLADNALDLGQPLRHLTEVYQAAPAQSLVNRMLFLDWKITLADNDLRKVEVMAESAGVRVSYPLLDPQVVELSARVPPELKVRRLRLRHFYKEAMRDFLPRATITKSKHGFGLPFGEWLRDSSELRALVFDALSDLKRRQIFDAAFMDELLDSHQREHAGYFGSMIWLLCILELWLKEHRLTV